MQLVLETCIDDTPRVAQLRGLFDLPEQPQMRRVWDVALPLSERDWSIGLITGTSGSGKSSIARHCFPSERGFLWMDDLPPWPSQRAVVDGFPSGMAIREITEWLSTVGFSSPPAWLQPAHTLSTGQRFRADLARLLATAQQQGRIAVCDEFTSVVDRTVAQIGSAAIAKAVRRQRMRFIAITCHADVETWLQPEWRFRPELAQCVESDSGNRPDVGSESAFVWRSVQPRPQIAIDLVRTTTAAWPIFAPHHYLSHRINPAAVCFLALHRGEPIGFSAWINHFSTQGGKREHRTVVMPDWQGVGVGMAMAGTLAGMWRGLGFRATSTTTHPGLIAARYRHPHWLCTRAPSMARPRRLPTSTPRPPSTRVESPRPTPMLRHATQRLTAGFRYIGPAMPPTLARWLLNGTTPFSG
ncbi:ABC transporter ATP-binding protein [Tuwongella immobilis]|uniref:Abc transporter atp-binding protein: Uncharacterized protein n=1 Tax=Tuwongella immobilis TaxID=692036 RepID=A0A6C2YH51_9BACT|nr:ABC transporter ATP-binding protein [Tuwongella immobilis]VIP00684.1 abc transporter atp-binding protein : Uncharacterized protein OS=Planctomyces maris DSM 8797 GN=PM8797T_10219 PE=4 SV=1 [Tuwongella immobilis]VTR96786.1 abc transporter atp-binding protein : Uncharacterized protein OS=Planctomyces maris DSM 8797 GN=PM8797T_10219 PE=4 SV=1 [Tuwongella immobilis]